MKTISKIILCLFLFTGLTSYSQVDKKGDTKQKPTFEKLEEMRVGFVLKKLDLTDDEQSKFGPLYKKYRKEYLELMAGSGEFAHKRPKEEDIKKMSDQEAKAFIEDHLAQKRKMLNLKEKYFKEFGKIMTYKKVALLFQAEIDFQRKLFRSTRKGREKKEKRKP